jgi:hypothetical protein
MFAEEPDSVRVDNAMSALDEFPSECAFPSETSFSSEAAFPIPPTALDAGNPPPVGASETLTVSLREVQRAGVAFEWDEAVAIAQSLCHAFLAIQLLPQTAFDRMPSSVELSLARSEAVVIDAAGHVLVSGGPRSVTEAIHCVGATLSDLLPAADPLCIGARVVSKAAASSPVYESLEALSQALTAYEFRDRRDLIGRVFQRATRGALPETIVTLSKTVPKLTKHPSRLPDVAAKALAAWERTGPLLSSKALPLVAICAIAACAVGIGGWLIWNRPSHPDVIVIPAAPHVERSLERVDIPALEELLERASLEPLVAAAASGPVNRTDSGVRPAVSNRRPVNHQPLGNVVVDSGAKSDDLPAVASPIDGGLPAATIEVAPPAVPIRSGAERTAVGSSRPQEDRLPVVDRTYDRDNADVTPPSVMYNRKLSGILSTDSPGIRAEVLIVAVIVTEDGKVDSVKAVTPPRNIGESLVLLGALSAIKSVQFRPAMKDGVPVKYNLIVPVRASQPIQ